MRIGIAFLVLAAVVWLQVPTVSAPDAETYAVDPVHSSVLFRIKHLDVAYFYGRFNQVSGTFKVDETGTGSVSITVDANSVDSNNDQRDGHLKSPDFFNVKQFPEITFKSDKLTKTDDDLYEAEGTFTLHGVSQPLTVELERTGSGKGMKDEWRTGFETTFTLNRSEFGMNWRPEVLGDEVTVTVSIEGIRQ